MPRTSYAASAVIEARPEELYRVLADYRNEHPRVIPAQFLHDLQVEEGGYGAGTIIRYRTRSFGVERPARARVSEPEPGRVLQETITTSPHMITTFTLTPIDEGQRTRLQIATSWEPARNMREKLEQLLYPYVMSRMYHAELRLINHFMRRVASTL
ncbi:MAG TPA: SRPBCC family protein [Ktedonobacteraceae bacterium]|jgi:hypothetical protein|nr:SRPBCC family protein [Ktedonobacteraceae bacterium]